MKRSAIQRKPWQPRQAKVWEADTLPTLRVAVLRLAVLRRVVKDEASALIRHFSGTPLALIKPIPKGKPWRCEEYRRLVATTLPCAHCGHLPPNQFCHGDEGKGLALKSSDLSGWSGCADRPGRQGCHSIVGSTGLFKREHRRMLEAKYAAQTRAAIKAAGLWRKEWPDVD